MSKSIRQWLNELPEPYRSQALESADKKMLDNRRMRQSDALSSAFVWKRSPEKEQYWKDLWVQLLIKEMQK